MQEASKNYKIDDENIETISKFTWKKNVKSAIHNKVETDTLENMKKYKKIKYELKVNETLELKQYMKSMNLSRARIKFSLETEMVKNFKFNFMDKRDYEKSYWSCDFCWKEKKIYNPDSIQHAFVCDEYDDLRKNDNISEEINFVDYYSNSV